MWRRLLGYSAAVGVGLAVKTFLFPHLFATGWAVTRKLVNRGELCSWDRTLTYYSRIEQFDRLYHGMLEAIAVAEHDPALNIDKVVVPGGRALWLVRPGNGGEADHAWVLAEHDWMERSNIEDHVQPGDVVIDIGAGAGVFTAKALKRGASKVVAVESDARNVECLRRNFQPEIAFGRVVVASPVAGEASTATADKLVSELKLARIHFIRVGDGVSERQALEGASRTIRSDRPRVMVGMGQRVNGRIELPALLRAAHAGYRASCGPCLEDPAQRGRVVPHVVYYR